MSAVSQQWCEKGDGRRASFEGFGHLLCQRCYREFIESQASGGRIDPDWGVMVKDDPRQMTLGENWRQRKGD